VLGRNLRSRTTICLLLASFTLGVAGCEQSVKQVRVQPPAATPLPVIAKANVQSLPLLPRSANLLSVTDNRPAVEILVGQVQANVDAAQREFAAGQSDQAQTSFDNAIDLMLHSGFEPGADPQLKKLYDQVGDLIQSDDLNAPDETDQADQEESETPAQPAPIDEIADLTLPAGDPRLALKAQQELISVHHDLPLTVNESVLQYLSYFTTPHGRLIVEHGLERAGRYQDMIRRVLREEGVPQDLIYLAQAESAFLPEAVSRAGARGIWQFMPFRGEEYDLSRSYWIDERSDPEKATRAAAHHMRDLYGMFGDWYLVMAAYNSGPLNVQRAIERTGYADFWQLQKMGALPKQTQNYVPIIIALALVAKAPALYGVHVDPEKPDQVETVKLDHPIDLRLVSDASGADLDEIRSLNPELLRTVTPNLSSFELKLPAGMSNKFEENIQQVPEERWTSWRLHTSEEGETLPDIARHYRVTLSALETANHLEPRSSVPDGFLLTIPTPPPPSHLLVHYRVQRGDTLAGIADRFDVTVAQLKHWNHIYGSHVPRGTRLRIYAGAPADSDPVEKRSSQSRDGGANLEDVSTKKQYMQQHRVKPGETLYSIARSYQTTVSALRESNPFLAGRPLEAGDVLTIRR
jgi:membrane-bound lytic murein transglycosylase D